MAPFYVWKVKIFQWVYYLIVSTIWVGTVVNLIITSEGAHYMDVSSIALWMTAINTVHNELYKPNDSGN